MQFEEHFQLGEALYSIARHYGRPAINDSSDPTCACVCCVSSSSPSVCIQLDSAEKCPFCTMCHDPKIVNRQFFKVPQVIFLETT